ncbi:MAG: LPS export ABC transporter periplasmic protein LptC [Bacteroidales bacterium]|nr:LPS export ABC transporter periplasmic protein LptC [Bacteroidales bacterium]
MNGFIKAAGSIVIFILLTMLFACENDPEVVKKITQRDTLPLESAKDIDVLYSEYGEVQFRLKSPQLDHYDKKEPYMEFPKGFHIWFYDTLQNVKSEVSANYGIRYTKKKMMKAKENVVVENKKNNEELRTEELIWKEREHKIYSDKFVTIKTQDKIIYGVGFSANEDFTNWTIKDPRGEFKIKQEE